MKEAKERNIFDSPKNRSRIRTLFYLCLIVLLAVDYMTPKHGHFPWEEAYAFYAVYGFMGCVSLIFVAKALRWLVKREEDYYD